MTQKPITPEDVDEAIRKLRFPKPKISSDEAAKKAVALFNERPEANHCAPSTIIALQEAYDLPGGELPSWIAIGFRGGVCLGEICGTLSSATIAMGLMAYKVLEPRTDHEQRIACQALLPYIRDLAYAFNHMFGSIHCAVLTRQLERTPEEEEIHARIRLTKDICSPFVDFVVRTMVKWGEISQEPPPRLPQSPPPLKLG
ncbi:hypothetical protein ES703_20028 [subsurface metagenome]